MRQVISYLQVSTDKQGKNGLGIEAQRDAVARFIAAEGCEVLGEFVEVETGKMLAARGRRGVGTVTPLRCGTCWRDNRSVNRSYLPTPPTMVIDGKAANA
jgi:hypothetical protein